MFAISTNGDGQCPAFPDVCKTPSPGGPIPIPYPNIAMLTDAQSCSSDVKIQGKKVFLAKSEISMSTGDEAGSAGGGVVSNKIKGEAKPKKSSSKVKVEGSPVVYHSCPFGQNGSNANAMGVQASPSQTKVFVTG
jgi:hypothetical protein